MGVTEPESPDRARTFTQALSLHEEMSLRRGEACSTSGDARDGTPSCANGPVLSKCHGIHHRLGRERRQYTTVDSAVF